LFLFSPLPAFKKIFLPVQEIIHYITLLNSFIPARNDFLFSNSKHKPKTMKQIFFLLTAMAVLIACNDTTKVAGSNDDKMDDHAKASESMKEVYHAIETGDVSKMDSLMTDDCVDHNAGPDGSDVKGRDSIKKMLSEIHNYFEPGLKVQMLSDAISDDGNYHFAMIRMTGKAKANPWGIPAGEDVDDTSVDKA
jgi:ketosteroid isomerase-like protein